MTQDAIRTLSDVQLEQVLAWSELEKKERAAKRKQETIAKIKEMAQTVGVSVSIVGTRGRPPKAVNLKSK